ncbi:MAG: RIP metalloprotease RseP [Candidatus Margulisiibacteriota bacterium]
MITILSFIVVFSLVAVTHELGHLISAKRAGIEVYEFAIGFGPRIFGFIKGKTAYNLNLFPFGGYVRIAGIDPDHDEHATPESNKYYSKPTWEKFKTIISGPLMNIALGFIIIYFVLTILGVPTGITNSIKSISPGSEAEKIGLMPGDQLVALNGHPTKDMEAAIRIIHASGGKRITLEIQRGGKSLKLAAAPQYNETLKVALVGFSLEPVYKKINPLEALWLAAKETVALIVAMAAIIGKLIIGQVPLDQLAGPVGIAQISGQYAKSGILAFVGFISFFSLNVAVINLLPLPALDGGRLVFIIIEAVRRKPIPIDTENKVHYWGLMFLLALMAILTINDLWRIVAH